MKDKNTKKIQIIPIEIKINGNNRIVNMKTRISTKIEENMMLERIMKRNKITYNINNELEIGTEVLNDEEKQIKSQEDKSSCGKEKSYVTPSSEG